MKIKENSRSVTVAMICYLLQKFIFLLIILERKFLNIVFLQILNYVGTRVKLLIKLIVIQRL